MEKRKLFAGIPEFDQTKQYIVQLTPVETDDEIYYGVEVHDLEVDTTSNDMEMHYTDVPELTEAERLDQIEAGMIELASIIAGGE